MRFVPLLALLVLASSSDVHAQSDRRAPTVSAHVDSIEGRDAAVNEALEAFVSGLVRACAPRRARVGTDADGTFYVRVGSDSSVTVEPASGVTHRPNDERATTAWIPCVMHHMRAASWPAGAPMRATISVGYSVEPPPGTLTAGSITGPGVIIDRATVVPRGFTPDIARRVVRRQASQMRFCYEQALAQSYGYESDYTLEMDVLPTGSITDARAHLSHAPTLASTAELAAIAQLEACLTAAGRRWSFPVFEGAPLVVTITGSLYLPE